MYNSNYVFQVKGELKSQRLKIYNSRGKGLEMEKNTVNKPYKQPFCGNQQPRPEAPRN
jgi:hypothetical protein